MNRSALLVGGRRGGCLVWGLVVVGLLGAGVIGTGIAMFGYFGPPLPEGDDVADWRAIGARSWGVDTPGDWEPVREVLRLSDEAETSVGGAPVVDHEGRVERQVEYGRDLAAGLLSFQREDPDLLAAQRPKMDRAAPAIEAMRDLGVFEKIEALPAAAPVYEWKDLDASVSMVDAPFTDTAAIRQLMRALARRFEDAADRGDTDDAVASARQLAIVSEVIGRQPTMISRLVGMAGRGLLAETIARRVVVGECSPELLAGLGPVLDRAAFDGLDHAFRGESIAARNAIRNTMGNEPLVFINAGAQYAPVERLLEACAQGATLPTREAIQAINTAWDENVGEPDYRYLMVELLVPAVTRSAAAEFASLAKVHGVRVAVALERHRLEHGRFPESLAELVGGALDAIPEDPFRENGFVYRPGEDPTLPASQGGCVLYSVGLDGVDDGGEHPKPNEGRRAVDPFWNDGAGTDFVILGPDSFTLDVP